MRLITRGRRAPLHTNTASLDIPRTPPRDHAIQWLREKILDGHAGLDVYDPSVFILNVATYEQVWGYRAVELAGTVLSRHGDGHGGQRIRGVLEADARQELGLDELGNRPWIVDEPLASRAVDPQAGPAFVHPFPPQLRIVEDAAPAADELQQRADAIYLADRAQDDNEAADEPESMLALRVARAAYDRRNGTTEEAS